jgi:hypothetical protein
MLHSLLSVSLMFENTSLGLLIGCKTFINYNYKYEVKLFLLSILANNQTISDNPLGMIIVFAFEHISLVVESEYFYKLI